MAFDKEPKITFSILKDAEMDEAITEILTKYKGSDFSTEELNLRVEVDKVFYVLSRCLAKLNVVVSNIIANIAFFSNSLRETLYHFRNFPNLMIPIIIMTILFL